MIAEVQNPTFRDPSGSVRIEADRVVRSIREGAIIPTLEFIRSEFYLGAVARGDLIASAVERTPAGLNLIHPRLEIASYPWEWTPSQWLAAAELTIELGREAIAAGWILKDATPLNILFVGSRPIFVDVLSFERRDPASAIWLAYGQFVRTFLLPLVMHKAMGRPLALTMLKRDGYEPKEVYRSLSWRKRLSRAALWPITLPTWLEGKSGATKPKPPAGKADPELTRHILNRTLAGLRRQTRRTVSASPDSQWLGYQANLTHYSALEGQAKHHWIRKTMVSLAPHAVLDLGANTGEYSALAAACGARVVAIERDAAAAEQLFRMSRQSGLTIQTIQADIARPTPAVGWNNKESVGLLQRLNGNFDLVMMLAMIHHLILMEQIPLAEIVALCYRLTRRYLILEWVPATDPMYQSLMRGRDDLYGKLTIDDLFAACAGYFDLTTQETLGNGRVLLLFEKL